MIRSCCVAEGLQTSVAAYSVGTLFQGWNAAPAYSVGRQVSHPQLFSPLAATRAQGCRKRQ